MGTSSGQKNNKSGSRNSSSSSSSKKAKSWASRERAGKSFVFVLAFFAVFGIIILTEVSSRSARRDNK